jgi:hypothetical protein
MADPVTSSVLAGLRTASGTGTLRSARQRQLAPYAEITRQSESLQRARLAQAAITLQAHSRVLQAQAAHTRDEKQAERLLGRSGAMYAAAQAATAKRKQMLKRAGMD